MNVIKGFFRFGNPILELILESRKINFLLDTGFNGEVMIPIKLVEELGLEQIGVSQYVSASWDIELTNIFKGKIKFFDKDLEVEILSTDANFSLAGMRLFHECRIVIEMDKNQVEITKSG